MRKFIGLVMALAVGMTAEADEVSIATASELEALTTSFDNNNTYKLTADITITLGENETWTPIGSSTNTFNTTFDGQGHTITGLKIDVSANSSGYVSGLFAAIGAGGVVKDLNIGSTEVKITGADNNTSCYIGAIAGTNAGTIIGCANRGVEVYGNFTNANVGGIAGQNSGTIANCYNLGQVYSSSSYTGNNLGGIVGINSTNGTVKNCFARNPTAEGNGTVGSIYGENLGVVTACIYMNGSSADAIGNILTISDNADNASALSTVQGEVKNVLLADRTIYSDGDWNSLCLPFSIPTSDYGSPIAGADVRELTAASFDSSTGTLSLTFSDATSIIAGKPYIIRWTNTIADDLSNPVFMGVTVSSTTPTAATYSLGSDKSIKYVGNYSPRSIGPDNTMLYIGSKNKLYYPNKAKTINSCRAIFELTGLAVGEAASARYISIDFGDGEEPEVTAIMQTAATVTTADPFWYTTDGIRLNGRPTQKGIYVNNGRKMVIK